jgi:hypothetical protein
LPHDCAQAPTHGALEGANPYVVFEPENQLMEEAEDPEVLLLLQEIYDMLVATNEKLAVQASERRAFQAERKLSDETVNPRKLSDSERRYLLIERLFQRHNPNSEDFFDHIPFLQKRLYRIHRAGKPKRSRSKSRAVGRGSRIAKFDERISALEKRTSRPGKPK